MLNEEKKLVTIKTAGEMLQLGLAQSGDRDLVSVYLSMGRLFALISRHDWQASEFKSSQVSRYPRSKYKIFLDYLHPQIIFNFIISTFDFFFSCSHKWPLFRHSRYVSEASWIDPSQVLWYPWSKFDFVFGAVFILLLTLLFFSETYFRSQVLFCMLFQGLRVWCICWWICQITNTYLRKINYLFWFLLLFACSLTFLLPSSSYSVSFIYSNSLTDSCI